MDVTKREVLFSIVIICIMLIIGIVISGNINDAVMEKQQEYTTALQIDNDKDLFEYGMRTNIGNAFVYGELKAVDTVTFDEVGGQYSYIEKIKEKYTRHTRTVTVYDEDGDPVGTREEVYWTWDEVDSWDKHSEKITFLGVEFDYGTINFPYHSYIDTQDGGHHIRYVYYGSPICSTGTIYTKLGDGTIPQSTMYHGSTIEETLEIKTSDFGIVFFWIVWLFLTGGAVYGFCYLDNRWLEDNHRKRYY
jgi:hypothetical protein